MDIRSLECFLAVAGLRHFRRAAIALNMTQPTLSQRIRVLEQEVGAALFERDRRGVSLSAAGAAFEGPARAAVSSAKLAVAQARRALDGEVGWLRLGFTVIAFHGALPELVHRFRARYPDVAVQLVERSSSLLEASLLDGELDLAVLHPPLHSPLISTQPLADEQLVLALPSAHSLARLDHLTPSDIAGQPFLIAPRSVGPHLYDRLIAYFRSHKVTLHVVQEVTPVTTLSGLVAAGVGIGLVTEGLASFPRPGVVFRPLVPEPPRLPIAAAWIGMSPTKPARHFLDLIASSGTSQG